MSKTVCECCGKNNGNLYVVNTCEYICQECFEENLNFKKCDDCGCIIDFTYAGVFCIEDEEKNYYICETCREYGDFYYCNECDQLFHGNDIVEHNGDNVCINCKEELETV